MIDREQLYIWWRIFQNNGNKLCEIRCLDGNRTYSGYYHSIDNIIRDIEPLSERPNMQMYFVLNTIKEDCYDRQQQERLIEKPKNTTSDNDIEGRSFILLDFDPERPSGVGSTNEQLEEAHFVAKKVYNFLIEQGLTSVIVCKSGNGVHFLVPIMLANTPENTKLVERFLKSISMLFSTEKVHCDTKVANASRICKLYGTFAKKGSNTEEHPWRLAKFWKVPDEIIPNKKDYIEKIANLYQDTAPVPSKENNYGRSKFDIIGFFNRHNIEYRQVKVDGGTRYILKECAFDSNHKDPDSMVFQHDNGALSFFCYHNSCSQFGWKDYRLKFEPDAYDKKDYREFRSKQQYYEKYEPIQIKKETSENGKKWLDWNDIQDINDADLVAIKSGYFLLDKLIKGWVLGELTILCGLNSSGKSTILNSFALNAIQRNYPTAYFSGELRPQRLKQWIAQVAAGKANVTKNPDTDFSYDVNPSVLPNISEWLNGKLKIYSHEKYGNLSEQLVNDIVECITKFGVKLILIDNLMSVSLDGENGDKNEKQKNFVIKVSNIAKMHGVHVILVVHPRKENGLQFLRKESVKGAGDITDAADNVLLIHRVGDDFEKRATEFLGKERVANLILYDNVIEIAKNRDYGNNDKYVGLYFEPESRRYKNSKAENIHYDWEEQGEEYTLPTPTPTAIPPNTNFDNQTNTIPIEDENYWAQYKNDETTPF